MTVKQKQNLLAYLGYYVGEIDGIWGTLSKVATTAFQKDFGGIVVDGICGTETQKAMTHAVCYGMPAKDVPDSDVGDTEDQDQTTDTADWWDNVRYWSRNEFACRCGEYHTPYCDGFPVEPDRTLVELADDTRAHFGRPGHRSSGIRCTQHNADSGGVTNSRHLQGKALDFYVEGVSGATLLAYVQSDPRCRYAYIIEGQYVHMDVE